MPTATQAKTFNYDLLRKRVRLFDSNSDGERNLAVTQALRQCAEHEPPLLFYEAVCDAFGGGNNTELEKLRAEFEELKAVASALNDENQRLMEEVKTLQETLSDSEWPAILTSQPKPLLVILGLCVALEWLAGPLLRNSHTSADIFYASQAMHTICMALFFLWSVAVYKREYVFEMVKGWTCWGVGWFAFIAWLVVHGRDRAFLGAHLGFIPAYYWNCLGPDFEPGEIAVALSLLAVVIDVNLGLPAIRWTLATLRDGIAKLLELIA